MDDEDIRKRDKKVIILTFVGFLSIITTVVVVFAVDVHKSLLSFAENTAAVSVRRPEPDASQCYAFVGGHRIGPWSAEYGKCYWSDMLHVVWEPSR